MNGLDILEMLDAEELQQQWDLRGGKCHKTKYENYQKGVMILEEMQKGGLLTFEADDLMKPKYVHMIIVRLNLADKVEFDAKQVGKLFSYFDSFGVSDTDIGEIYLASNIYEE